MNLLLKHHQSVINLLRKAEPTVNIKELLDEVVGFLNNTTYNQTDGFQILTVICFELASCSNLKLFNKPEIMNHQFFIILSSTLKMFLTKLTFISLTKQDELCFDGISLLISNLCKHNNQISTCFYTNNNEKLDPNNKEIFQLISYEKIFFTEIFIKKFVRFIKGDIVKNDDEPFHIKYKIIDRLLRLFMKLKDINLDSILEAVMECLKSKLYRRTYLNTDLHQPILNPKQSFFMYQCPRFIRLCGYKRQNEISYELCRLVLGYRIDIFEKHLPIALHAKEDSETKTKTGPKIQAVAWYMELLNYFALTPSTREFFITRKDSDKTMVDQIIEILKTEPLIISVRKSAELFHADVALMSYSITLLYNLTFEKKIFYDLKDKKVISICEELYTAKDRTIQFASRTLGAILNKEDIDEINSPTEVARSYLYFIENTLEDVTLTFHGIKLDGVLTNLEAIIQNDDIKEEITNDDEGISTIGRCTYGKHLDVDTIQRPALRIIDAISFVNDSAVKQIKENDFLMEHIKNLSEKHDAYQESIANRLLWKVDKEFEFISQQEKRKKRNKITRKTTVFDEKQAIYQYVRGDHRFNLSEFYIPEKFDIMISYCPDDKDICQKIYDRLMASDSYRISFDKDNIFRLNPGVMAKAIEGSSIILLCFSNNYRNSYACRLEAEYAEKRERPIIPIKVYPYEPTGWLKKIIAEKNPTDFTKGDFNNTYAQLIVEINDIDEKINKD